MGPLPNKTGSLSGESSPLNRPGSSLRGIKAGLPPAGLFPFTVVHAAILMFSLYPRLKGPVPGLSFAPIKPRFPRRGLFPSAVVHAAILIFFSYLPLFNSLNPPRIIEEGWDDLRSAPHDAFVMTEFSYSARMALAHAPIAMPSAEKLSNANSARRNSNIPTPPAQHEETATAQPVYSGPQEVVSISPNSTNSVQTILRPDLANPPTLKFPQLLKPVVILPSSVAAAPDAKPANPAALPASAQRIKDTPVELPVGRAASTASLPIPDTQHQPLPEIEFEIPASGPLAAIVLNAVTVPENAPAVVPPAELPGSFALRSDRSMQSTAGAGTSGESTASSDATKAANNVAKGGRGEAIAPTSATPTRKDSDGRNSTRMTSAGNSAGNSNPNRSSQVTGTSQGGNTGVGIRGAHEAPGITIIGGVSRSGSGVGVSATRPTAYGLTVISSGSSGGASRDLGVFDRSETVYTVYIPMADVGGGPDWSIQYAILGPAQAGNGLLTPPVAVKKVRAVVTGDLPDAPPTIIFFSAVISANGELEVKLPRQMDVRAHQALDALRQWEFLPAQLNGIAVWIKVLIGVGTGSQ